MRLRDRGEPEGLDQTLVDRKKVKVEDEAIN